MKNQSSYFNFTCDALAYLNEIKMVTPRQGKPYVAIKAIVLEGIDGENKIPIDLTICGHQAKEVISSLAKEWPQGYGKGTNWFAGIRIGSLGSKSFFRGNGQPGSVLNGRLLAIKWLKIDGESIDIPEWRTGADADGDEQYADDARNEGIHADREVHQQSEPPQPRGQRLQPQTQQQRQGQPQRQPQVRQNAPQRRAQLQGQVRRRNSAA